MLTKKEINTLNLSPTKKDFVQIWNELLEVAGKLSERWDPTSTNEGDPGIVLLKVLTGIADKLNYNIDKNTLEAFMPTAAQEDSMRKLCEMLGYDMKYYQSAVTAVTVRYHNLEPDEDEAAIMVNGNGFTIPKFTVITNADKDINYFTLPVQKYSQDYYISAKNPIVTLDCMEGQIVKCESINDNNVININQISENNRFYLPEAHIAENGIFIFNIFTQNVQGQEVLSDGEPWEKVDNLNLQEPGTKVFKFGYDSYESRPYLEFPEDYSELFNEGIFIYYTRTNGVNGNISPKTLTQIELPSSIQVSSESFSAENSLSATSGKDAETIKQAYKNFKKTIGTFETLVTCRDYMNKIYSMVDSHNKPLVSNILVTDIRNDLNHAVTICSCNDAGIFYKEVPLCANQIIERKTADIEIDTEVKGTVELSEMMPVFKANSDGSGNWFLGNSDYELSKTKLIPSSTEAKLFDITKNGHVSCEDSDYWTITQVIDEETGEEKTFVTSLKAKQEVNVPVKTVKTETYNTTKQVPSIDSFDLVFYPFKCYNQINSKTDNVKNIKEVYENSFKYTEMNLEQIKARLEDESLKTIAHNIKTISPDPNLFSDRLNLVSINNYLRLNATVATNYKLTTVESAFVIDNIKKALANAFNMRELDFGESIPFESIVEVIEKADARIKVVSLTEPALYTTFTKLEERKNGEFKLAEYAVASDWLSKEEFSENKDDDPNTDEGITQFNKRFSFKSSDGTTKSTFNTDEAKKIYNKLAVRNILAGRVPLFDYNKTFETSFNESRYLVIEELDDCPQSLTCPSKTEPYTIINDNGTIYTGQYLGETKSVFKKASPPDFLKNSAKESLINTVNGNKITNIATYCNVPTDEEHKAQDVLLSSNEIIRFRAPNFRDVKTFPAYVNYHLILDKATAPARPAKATSLFTILDEDRTKWSSENTNIKWQKVLDYFATAEKGSSFIFKERAFLSQTVSALKQSSISTSDTEANSSSIKDSIKIAVNNTSVKDDRSKYSLEELLNLSGCIKLVSNKATLSWTTDEGDIMPNSVGPDLPLELDLDNPFITDLSVIEEIKTKTDEKIKALLSDGAQLPTECAWKIEFEFEGVPFVAASLAKWENFVRGNASNRDLFSFTPIEENNTFLWRVYSEGYIIGKYVLDSSKKLLQFDANYFGKLSEEPLDDIYLVEYLGKDAEAPIIKNNEEYELTKNEYLYIEYTPSTITETGTTQTGASITEIHGEGTIIRPEGFEVGLMDSRHYEELGNEFYKTVTFKPVDNNPVDIQLHRFGANEQVAIRDFAKVELPNETFTKNKSANSSFLCGYFYKNFNDCPELEYLDSEVRTYTLKDGEFIAYTNENKADFAYYTSGTEVTIAGNIVFKNTFDKIGLDEIFENGLENVPWQQIWFTDKNAKITFQEFQYVTLAEGDTLKTLKLVGSNADDDLSKIDSQWKYCENVQYITENDPENLIELPTINLQGDRLGNGWEVSSSLLLAVAPNSSQMLRNTDKIETGLVLTSTNSGGQGNTELPPITPGKNTPDLAFKTNLNCQVGLDQVDIENEIINPDSIKGFELTFFNPSGPTIVQTVPHKVVPYQKDIDINNWQGIPVFEKGTLTSWNAVDFGLICPDSKNYDNALRLPINLLPKTYGIVCIYIDYTSDDALATAETWIEVVPGHKKSDFSLFNYTSTSEVQITDPNQNFVVNDITDASFKLKLKPGINCVRINKSGNIFIKTTANAQGTLFFDELKLVNIKDITYEGTDGKRHVLTTKGLNLSQINYLPVTTSSEIDEQTSTEIFSNIIVNFLDDLSEVSLDNSKNITTSYQELLGLLPKIEKVVGFEKSIIEELDNILGSLTGKNDKNEVISRTQGHLYKYSTDLSPETLLYIYKELVALVADEKALLEALNKKGSIKEIEQNLLKILEYYSLESCTETQQLLLQKLVDLVSEVRSKSEQLTNKDFIDDFNTVANYESAEIEASSLKKLAKESVVSAWPEIQNMAIQAIEAWYQEQVSLLFNILEQDINFDDRSKFTEILNNFSKSRLSELQVKLAMLINLLKTKSDFSDVDEILLTMTTQANTPSYASLSSSITKLRNLLKAKDLSSFIAEIVRVAGESNNKQLQHIIDNLELDKALTIFKTIGLVDADSSTNDESINDLKKALNSLDAKVTAAIEDNLEEVDPDIVKELKELNNLIVFIQANELNSLISKINTALEEIKNIESEYDLVSGLQYNDSKLLNGIIEKFQGLRSTFTYYLFGHYVTNSADTELGILHTNMSKKYACSPNNWEKAFGKKFIEKAIIQVWPKYVKPRMDAALDVIKVDFEEAISLNTAVSTFSELFMTTRGQLSNVLQGLFDINSFNNLYNEIISLEHSYIQKKNHAALIDKISDNLITTSKAAHIIDKLSTDDYYINSSDDSIKSVNAIYNIVALVRELRHGLQYVGLPIEKTNEKVNILINELNTVITTDEQLIKVIEMAVCPTISQIIQDKSLEADDFYKPLLTELKFIKSQLFDPPQTSPDPSYDIRNSLADFKRYYGSEEQKKDANLLRLLQQENLESVIEEAVAIVKSDYSIGVSELLPIKAPLEALSNSVKIESDLTKINKLFKVNNIFLSKQAFLDNIKNLLETKDDYEKLFELELKDRLNELYIALNEVYLQTIITEDSYKKALATLNSENQMLADINQMDPDGIFYYSAPIDPVLAIDLNEDEPKLNTLMNPSFNYDVNNVLNNFVISKIDFDYLDKGIKIARSSKISTY